MNTGIKGKRGAHKNARAKARNAERKKLNRVANTLKMGQSWRSRGLTVWDRLNELDEQWSVGKGAAKERRKLLDEADRVEAAGTNQGRRSA